MDRASDYGSEGWEFKSLRARQSKIPSRCGGILFFTNQPTIGSRTADRRPFGKISLNSTGNQQAADASEIAKTAFVAQGKL